MIIEGLFFLFFIETICCDPSSEPSYQDGLDKGSQHMFLSRTDINDPLLSPSISSYLQVCCNNAYHVCFACFMLILKTAEMKIW